MDDQPPPLPQTWLKDEQEFSGYGIRLCWDPKTPAKEPHKLRISMTLHAAMQ